jgi:hypothetical protein
MQKCTGTDEHTGYVAPEWTRQREKGGGKRERERESEYQTTRDKETARELCASVWQRCHLWNECDYEPLFCTFVNAEVCTHTYFVMFRESNLIR